MEPTTNKRSLTIDGMTGDACVQKVRTALKGVSGVTAESVKVGSSTISCEEPAQCDAACSAIAAAGFRATDSQGTSDTNGTAPVKAPTSQDAVPSYSKGSSGMARKGSSDTAKDPAFNKDADRAPAHPGVKPVDPAVAMAT